MGYSTTDSANDEQLSMNSDRRALLSLAGTTGCGLVKKRLVKRGFLKWTEGIELFLVSEEIGFHPQCQEASWLRRRENTGQELPGTVYR